MRKEGKEGMKERQSQPARWTGEGRVCKTCSECGK